MVHNPWWFELTDLRSSIGSVDDGDAEGAEVKVNERKEELTEKKFVLMDEQRADSDLGLHGRGDGGMVECQEVDDAASMVVHVGGNKDDYGPNADHTMAAVVRKAKTIKSVKVVTEATR